MGEKCTFAIPQNKENNFVVKHHSRCLILEETHVFDELAAVQIPKINTDDLFVVTAKPKTSMNNYRIHL